MGKISYSDYLKLFPQDTNPSIFISFDLNPGIANEIHQIASQRRMLIDSSTISQIIDERIKMDKSTQNVFLNDKGQFEKRGRIAWDICSDYGFDEFNILSSAYRPVSVSRGQFLSPFGQTLGVMAPTKETKSKSQLKIGSYDIKTIDWRPGCYNEGFFMAIKTFKSGCFICPIYETFYNFISQYTYMFFVNIKDFVFYMTACLLIIFLGWDIFKGIYGGITGPTMSPKDMNKKYVKQAVKLIIAGLVLLPAPTTFFIPKEIIEFIAKPIFDLTSILVQGIMGKDFSCTYNLSNMGGEFEMLGNSFKQNYMCLVQSSFKVLMEPVLLGFSLLGKFKIIPGLILIFLFLKNLFAISMYLISPLIEICKCLFFLPLSIAFWVIDYKTNFFSFKDIWKSLVQICFISIFTAFFTMLIMLMLKAISLPDAENITPEIAEKLGYFGAGLFELIIIGFISSHFIKQIPKYTNEFVKYFDKDISDFDSGYGKKFEDNAIDGVKDVLDTKTKFKDAANLRLDPRYARGVRAYGKQAWGGVKNVFGKIKGWF